MKPSTKARRVVRPAVGRRFTLTAAAAGAAALSLGWAGLTAPASASTIPASTIPAGGIQAPALVTPDACTYWYPANNSGAQTTYAYDGVTFDYGNSLSCPSTLGRTGHTIIARCSWISGGLSWVYVHDSHIGYGWVQRGDTTLSGVILPC